MMEHYRLPNTMKLLLSQIEQKGSTHEYRIAFAFTSTFLMQKDAIEELVSDYQRIGIDTVSLGEQLRDLESSSLALLSTLYENMNKEVSNDEHQYSPMRA